ncbi:hypothetical protein CLI74_00410 [Porphyromonas gingivalis]|uniref:Uncharacterized protein n=1 Tax=Porphyromonas gingivalis F0570 TaxID=1227271 RepID=A0A0E2LP26_PORGN|nr:hypothetical protein HMPREF1555_01967 [Porphyromonas gingivalis F0570]PDP57879.1 hypothetical protein CLI74_00410 [Porphyromonas gingivalis]PDP77504.1 hypothetical protein CLI76_03735 [Porphyromonas gingivalis]
MVCEKWLVFVLISCFQNLIVNSAGGFVAAIIRGWKKKASLPFSFRRRATKESGWICFGLCAFLWIAPLFELRQYRGIILALGKANI